MKKIKSIAQNVIAGIAILPVLLLIGAAPEAAHAECKTSTSQFCTITAENDALKEVCIYLDFFNPSLADDACLLVQLRDNGDVKAFLN